MWVNWVPDDLHGLAIVQHALPAYDMVFASGTDVVEALAETTGRPVHYLPLAADPVGVQADALARPVPRQRRLCRHGHAAP